VASFICNKCGGEDVRKSNSQKYCSKCSKHLRPKKPRPEYLCCICGKPTGKKTAYNTTQRMDKHHNYPCADCRHIVARKRKAESIRMWRKSKKIWSKIGKIWIDWQSSGSDVFTPMRFVSQSEIDMMLQRVKDLYDRPADGVVVIRRSSTYGEWDGVIRNPGFYRVDIPEGHYYERTCSTGLPTWHSNHLCVRATEEIHAKHWKYWKPGEGKYEKLLEGIRKSRNKESAEKRKDAFLRSRTSNQINEFFKSLAIAGAVTEGAEKLNKERNN